jgi:hypothetical protein
MDIAPHTSNAFKTTNSTATTDLLSLGKTECRRGTVMAFVIDRNFR